MTGVQTCALPILHMERDSVHMERDSIHKIINHSRHKTQISNDQLDMFLQIVAVARQNKNLPSKKMEKIILNLCQGQWLNRKQLGELLKRNPDGLRSRFITPMVSHGLLRLRYPDKPNRVDQAYTAADNKS